MVRLVFRPFAQIRRTICTSVSLRTSTRVSPGFILPKQSSPSFGSQHTHSTATLKFKIGLCSFTQYILLLLCVWCLTTDTREYARLLGPCFKTGQTKHLPKGEKLSLIIYLTCVYRLNIKHILVFVMARSL